MLLLNVLRSISALDMHWINIDKILYSQSPIEYVLILITCLDFIAE